MREAKFGSVVAKVFFLSLLAFGGAWRAEANNTWVGGATGNPNDWNTAANWNPANVPGTGENVTVPGGLSAYPILTEATASLKNVTIDRGASLAIVSGGAFSMTGNPTVSGTMTISGGSFSANGNIDVEGALNMSGGTVSVRNFAVNGTVTMIGGTVQVGQDVGGKGTLSLGGGLLQVGRDFNPSLANFSAVGGTVEWMGVADANAFPAGTYEFFNVQIDAGANPGFDNQANALLVAGNWTDNGSVTLTRKATTVCFNGTGAQTVGGSVSTTFNNLTIANIAGVTLAVTVTVNSVLSLNSGVLTTGSNQICIAASGSVTGAGAASYVNGSVQKAFIAGSGQSFTFPVGDASTYSPINLTSLNVTTAGNLTARTTAGDHPKICMSGIDPAKDVNRYWTLTNAPAGIAASSYCATFNFAPADVDGGANSGNFLAAVYNGSWSGATVKTRGTTSTTVTGLAGFGDFAAGEPAGPPNIASCCLQTDRTAMLKAVGVGGRSYTIQASTDLRSWASVGSATADASGAFHFVDPDAPNFAQRFYRAVYP